MTTAITLQDVMIHPVVEQQAPFFDPLEFFPTLTKDVLEENRSWLQPTFIDPDTGRLVLCVQGFLIKTPPHKILVDSCVGNHKPRPARPFWNMMNSDRVREEPRGDWAYCRRHRLRNVYPLACGPCWLEHAARQWSLGANIPQAKYVMADRELAHWTQKRRRSASVPWITDSVLPIVEAKRAQIVAALNRRSSSFPRRVILRSLLVLVGQPGQDALITGDMIHSPLQGKYSELGMRADYDSPQAGQTRRKVFDRFCDASTIMCVTHFPSPSTGRVRRWGDGYKFVLE